MIFTDKDRITFEVVSGNVLEMKDGSTLLAIDTPSNQKSDYPVLLTVSKNGTVDFQDDISFFQEVALVYEGLNGQNNLSGWDKPDGTEVIWGNNLTVKLNSEYIAKVEGDEVVVGCQRIPVEKVRELARLIDQSSTQ